MVFNFSNTVNSALNLFKNDKIALVFGNSLSLIVLIIAILLLFVFLVTVKSQQKNKWKHFLVIALFAIILVTSVVFLHEYYRKNNIAKFFGSGQQKYDMPPDVFFDMKKPQEESTHNVFDELFANT